nr:CYTH and CHAD domain-containing protein [Cellulosimicrobium arenosum]
MSAPDDWSVPDPGLEGTTIVRPEPVHLDALYYDTADLRLLARGVTLRRRTGGADAGWHLKLPAPGDARDEIRRALGDDDAELPATLRDAPVPPAGLVGLVVGVTRNEPLVPVGRIRTVRSLVVLHGGPADGTDSGEQGPALVEIADDRVSTERLAVPAGHAGGDEAPAGSAGGRADAWREIEVELLPTGPTDRHGDGDGGRLLDDVVDVLVASGARLERSSPKLARALAVATAERGDGPGDVPAARDDATAGDVVVHHLREQVDALLRWDPEVRRDTRDAVHKSRVAARRLRSALATFRPLLDRDVTEPVRAELRWWGQVLGEARDAEVARDRVRVVLDGTPDELVVGPVRARVVDELDARYRDTQRAAVEQMGQERYLALLDALVVLAGDPPLSASTADPADPARTVLPPLARKAWKRARRRARAADAATGERRDELLHDVRKAAKRARYAGEAMAPALGEDAARFACRFETVQDALGEHHDAVGLAGTLRRLGMQANLRRENGFSYGLLVGVERQRAQSALEDYETAWERAGRRRVRRWTSS